MDIYIYTYSTHDIGVSPRKILFHFFLSPFPPLPSLLGHALRIQAKICEKSFPKSPAFYYLSCRAVCSRWDRKQNSSTISVRPGIARGIVFLASTVPFSPPPFSSLSPIFPMLLRGETWKVQREIACKIEIYLISGFFPFSFFFFFFCFSFVDDKICNESRRFSLARNRRVRVLFLLLFFFFCFLEEEKGIIPIKTRT